MAAPAAVPPTTDIPAVVPNDDIHMLDINNEAEEEAPLEQASSHVHASDSKNVIESPLEQEPSQVHMPDAIIETEAPLEQEPSHVPMPDVINETVDSLEQEPSHVHIPDVNNETVVSLEQEPSHVQMPGVNNETVDSLEQEPSQVHMHVANIETVDSLEQEPSQVHMHVANIETVVSSEQEPSHVHMCDSNNETVAPLEQKPIHDHMADAKNEREVPTDPEPNQVPMPDVENSEIVDSMEQEPNHVPMPYTANHERGVITEPEPNHALMPDVANSEIVASMEQGQNHIPMHDTATNEIVSMEQDLNHVHMHHAKFEMITLEPPHPDHHIIEPHPNHHVMEQHPDYVEVANNQMVPMDPQPDNIQLVNNEIVHVEHQANLVPINSPGTYPNKRRKKKSVVWEHFTIETYDDNSRRACCKQCKQSFAYSTGNKVAGTSHLKRHIAKGTCPVVLRNMEKNRAGALSAPPKVGGDKPVADTTPKRRYRTSTPSPYISFDADQCRHEISRMIIMHDYPLHIVEHPGFVAFVQTLQPRFEMVSFNTVQGDCVATYLTEKQSIQRVIETIPGRICLTLDMWSSSRSVGYVFLTGYFIDSDWKIHRELLNVIMEPYPESDDAFRHAVSACLSDWNLDGKLFSVTLNQPVSDAAVDNLKALVSVKNPLVLNGQLILGNCLARSLSTIAQEAFNSLQGTVKKVRDSVKYVKTSENVEEKFLELKQQLQVPSTKILVLDDRSKWDTTYEMLSIASELKEVFSCLDTSDPYYKDALSMEDWKNVEILCTYLRPLFETATLLTVPTVPTTNTFFHEAWKIQLELARAAANEDSFISSLTKSMQEKFDIYWRSCSFVLAIAVVMDPRFKMKLVEFSFSKIYGQEAATYVKIVDEGIHELFQEYVAHPLPLTPTYADDAYNGNANKPEDSQGHTNGLTDFDMYIMETTSQQSKTELDQYLEESLLPRVHEFDVVGWWKLNRMKYPTLSKMARDILSIPVCTVAADSVFDTVTKEMDRYKCSLRPETAEALICAKDWLQSSSAEASSALVQMEVPI